MVNGSQALVKVCYFFSRITSNVNFVETYMFQEFQKHQARNICQQHLYMSAVHLCTI